MAASRLRLLSPELDELMRRVDVDPRTQRRAAATACRLALASADVQDARAAAAMSLLDSEVPIGHEVWSELEVVRDNLDKRYLELHNSSDKNALILFSQARAIASICYVLSGERDLWSEAIYEAAMTMDDPSVVIAASLKALT